MCSASYYCGNRSRSYSRSHYAVSTSMAQPVGAGKLGEVVGFPEWPNKPFRSTLESIVYFVNPSDLAARITASVIANRSHQWYSRPTIAQLFP